MNVCGVAFWPENSFLKFQKKGESGMIFIDVVEYDLNECFAPIIDKKSMRKCAKLPNCQIAKLSNYQIAIVSVLLF